MLILYLIFQINSLRIVESPILRSLHPELMAAHQLTAALTVSGPRLFGSPGML